MASGDAHVLRVLNRVLIRGGALNLAARLCGQAAGGEILATERLVGLTGAVAGLHWDRPRAIRLKGVRDPERIVQIQPDESIPPPPGLPPEPRVGRSRRTLFVSGVAANVRSSSRVRGVGPAARSTDGSIPSRRLPPNPREVRVIRQ